MESSGHSVTLLSIHSVPGTVPDAENASVDDTDEEDQRDSLRECIQGAHSTPQLVSSLREPCWGRVNWSTAPLPRLWSSLDQINTWGCPCWLPERAGLWEPAAPNPQSAPK